MRLIWIALMTAVFFTTPVFAQGEGLSGEEISRIAESVVYVGARIDDRIDTFGSGTVVSSTGLIYTNRHVVATGEDFSIHVQETVGEQPILRYYASIVRMYNEIDLAVLQIDRDANGDPIDTDQLDLPYLDTFVSELEIGDRVYVFGYPGLSDGYLVVTQGNITSIENGTIRGSRLPVWYLTDAEISPGNSGGLAVNFRGEFIGIPTQVWKEDRTLGRLGGLLPYAAIQQVLVSENDTPSRQPRLTIINDSADEICYVHISPTTSTTWGFDWLESDEILEPGDIRSWRLDSGLYDVRLRDCDQNTLREQRRNNLSRSLVLRYTDEDESLNDEGYLYIEIDRVEHNTTISGRLQEGIRVYTDIQATGYNAEPLRVAMFYYWEDGTPVSGIDAIARDRTRDGALTVQTVITPDSNDQSWDDFWFWIPYDDFPDDFNGERNGYVQAMIAPDDEPLDNPSETAEFVIGE